MKRLDNEELKQIQGGGGIAVGLGFLIGAGIIFVMGLIDGYVNPVTCN